MRRQWLAAYLLAIAGLSVGAGPAQAHGFGQRNDLPIPLPLYLAGAGGVVGLSFVLAVVFLRTGWPIPSSFAAISLLHNPWIGD